MTRVRFRPWKCPDCGMTERKEPHRRFAHHMEAVHGKRWSDERGEYVLIEVQLNKTKPNVGDLRVWWIPQIPMKPFEADVSSVAEGVRLMDILAEYDKFQLDNRIKPDYSNVGGLLEWVSDDGDGKPGWTDWYDEETGDEDPRKWLEAQKENR